MVSISALLLFAFAGMPAFAEVQLNEQPEVASELGLPMVKWEDPTVKPAAIILAIHGITLHSKTFETTARFLAGKGYTTYAIDLRGMGKWRTEPDCFEGKSTMDFSRSKADVIKTIRALREEHPGKPIFLMGESYGSTLSAHVAIKEPTLVNGIILSSFCDKRLWKHPMWRMIPDAIRGFSMPFISVSLRPYTSKLLSPDPLVTRLYLEDKEIVGGITATRLVKILIENKRVIHRIKSIQVPVLALNGGKDGTRQPEVMPEQLRKFAPHQLQYYSLRKQGHLLLECQPKMNSDTAATLERWLTEQTAKQVASLQAPPSKNDTR